MKKKIVISLLLLFSLNLAGSALSALYIRNTTTTLERLINLHQIENLRQDLIMSIQTVQSELYTIGTLLGHQIDTITDNVGILEKNAGNCTNCHHSPEVDEKLRQIQSTVADYQNSLSYYITSSSDRKNTEKLKNEAAAIGNNLLSMTEQMSVNASTRLASMTTEALDRIAAVKAILVISMLAALITGIFIAIRLISSVSKPINALLGAARAISSGDLGYKVQYSDSTEFGELAENFNMMSSALKQGYEELEEEISERKATEAALVTSEGFLKTIFDSILDPFCIFDRNFSIVRTNEAYAALKSKGIDTMTGSKCYELFYGNTGICEDCIVNKTFLTGHTCAKEKKLTDPQGHELWLEIFTYPILDSGGSISHVIEYTRDISERKRSETALKESEQRYALASQGANDGLWDWNIAGDRIYFSIRWKGMLGYTDDEIEDLPDEWFRRLHPDDREKIRNKISKYFEESDQHFEVEYRIMHKDGNYLWMLCRGLAVRDTDGKPYRMAGSQTDITARKMAEDQLLHDAFHDSLTGLANRALFLDRLQNAINRSKRVRAYIYAVMFFDVDRFKVINDSLGHSAGDQLLIEISRRIKNCIRPGDTVARLGGDEFAVLLENITDVSDVKGVLDRIQRAFEHTPIMIEGNEIFVTHSIGVALETDRYVEPDQILCDADIAMYAAKAKGKARYEIFDEGMHDSVVDKLQLESDLRAAIEHMNDFILHYQPILNVCSHELVGFEALVRWHHPRRGIVHPLEFIPLAEETGLIHILGEWVIHEACRQLMRWQKEYHTPHPLKMSANVSGKQFLKDGFVETVLNIIKNTGIAPSSLAIEVTESIIMEDLDKAVMAMSRLRDAGIHIHIDDFGTGYSSLNYLNKFPVTALKIDKSFIIDILNNNENREIVRTIISLAQGLKLNVIAEGVELPDHLEEISNMECNYAQGYFFSKPMAPEDLTLWMLSEELVQPRKG